MSTDQLSSTSYLVLGLIAREGPSTPYDLKRNVGATIGHFWSFPHALLYKEPPRLVELGFLTEEREERGRRRRLFTITDPGRRALREWLERPSLEATELRDPGLLQLFSADERSADVQRNIAREQLPIHRAKLAGYEGDQRLDDQRLDDNKVGHLTRDHWRGQSLRMGVLYERAAVEFWEGVKKSVKAGATARAAVSVADNGKAVSDQS